MLKLILCACLVLTVALASLGDQTRHAQVPAGYVATLLPVPPPSNPLEVRGSRVVDVNSRGDVLAVDCAHGVYMDGADCKAVLWSSRTGSYRELFHTCTLGSCTQRVSDVMLLLNERGEIGGRVAAGVAIWSERAGLRVIGPATWTAYRPVVGFNDREEIAGVTYPYPPPAYKAFLASERTGVQLLTPAYFSVATAMNPQGAIIGWAQFTEGAPSTPFYWSARDGMIDIAAAAGNPPFTAVAINHQGIVLGAEYGTTTAMLLWHPQRGLLAKAPLEPGCAPSVLTAGGDVIGFCSLATLPPSGWIWSRNTGFRQLGPLGYDTFINDSNSAGQIVGATRVAPWSPWHAFVWSSEGGLVDLDEANPTRASNAWAISEDGVVGGLLGDGVSSGQAVIWTPVKR